MPTLSSLTSLFSFKKDQKKKTAEDLWRRSGPVEGCLQTLHHVVRDDNRRRQGLATSTTSNPHRRRASFRSSYSSPLQSDDEDDVQDTDAMRQLRRFQNQTQVKKSVSLDDQLRELGLRHHRLSLHSLQKVFRSLSPIKSAEQIKAEVHQRELDIQREALTDLERYNSASSEMSGQYKRKVIIMGAPSVGKTSLATQFVTPPQFTEGYYPTVESTNHKTIKHAGQEYDCEIIDSAGQDEYTLFPTKYANGVHGYLLVYSINSRQSFEMVQTIYDKILDFSGNHDMPTVVVGQKSDLVKTDQRRVTVAEGQALAKKLNAGFIESSAKDGTNVVKAFEVLCEEMQKRWNPAPEKKKSGWFSWGK